MSRVTISGTHPQHSLSLFKVNQSRLLATGGFASFAKVDSAFSISKTATSSPVSKARPAWQEGKDNVVVADVNPLAAETIQETTYTRLCDQYFKSEPFLLTSMLDVTGEENETVESELKGVKLYIKHGSREFTDGLIGHIKLLSNKDSESGRLREYKPVFCVTFHRQIGLQFSAVNRFGKCR